MLGKTVKITTTTPEGKALEGWFHAGKHTDEDVRTFTERAKADGLTVEVETER